MTDWEIGLQALADADAEDAGARYPQRISDAGPWQGATRDAVHAAMNRAVLDPAEVLRTSFPWAGHAGRVPTRYGPSLSRRRVERTQVA